MLKDKLIEGLYAGVMIGGAVIKENYKGEGEWFTRGYLHDITLPFGCYFLYKFLGLGVSKNKWINASYVFLGCSALETMQGLGMWKGTFDPKDYLAYLTGTGLAIAIDKLTYKKRTLDTLVD